MFMNCVQKKLCTQFESDAMIMVVGHQSVHTPDTYLCTLFTQPVMTNFQTSSFQTFNFQTFHFRTSNFQTSSFQHWNYQTFTNSNYQTFTFDSIFGHGRIFLIAPWSDQTKSFMPRVRKGYFWLQFHQPRFAWSTSSIIVVWITSN